MGQDTSIEAGAAMAAMDMGAKGDEVMTVVEITPRPMIEM